THHGEGGFHVVIIRLIMNNPHVLAGVRSKDLAQRLECGREVAFLLCRSFLCCSFRWHQSSCMRMGILMYKPAFLSCVQWPDHADDLAFVPRRCLRAEC